MRRAEIKAATGIMDATFTNYWVRGIIIANKDSGEGERDYSPESIPRINITRRLTALGYTIEVAVGLMSKRSAKEIDEKLGSLPAERLKDWIQQVVQEE